MSNATAGRVVQRPYWLAGVKPGDLAADKEQMRDYEGAFDLPVDGTESGWDPAFAAFVLTHAGCETGAIEVRIGERILVWCPCCAVLKTFDSSPE